MKIFKLFIYLFPLCLVTAQASQQEFNFNNNRDNTNERSSYNHGDIKGLENWLRNVKFADLKSPLENLYKNGIARRTNNSNTVPLVYFVVGPTGAGKSTFIYTLQGNKVIKKQTQGLSDWDISDSDNNNNDLTKGENETSDYDTDSNNIDTGQLTLKKNVDVDTPKVADSNYGVTEGVKIYYTGNSQGGNPIAFCDTEGFLGEREKDSSDAEKIVAAYAPCFVLKSNKIGGIVFLVTASDIKSIRGQNFFPCVRFLKGYFDVAMVGKNRQVLKESIMLIINKQEGDKNETLRKLAKLINASYEDYYNPSKNNKKEKPIGHLKDFLSLFLKKDVAEHEMKKTNFLKLLDKNTIRFFYPYESKNVEKMREKLNKLTPIPRKYLSLQDNPISQKLIQKMIHRAEEINGITSKVREHQDLAENCLFEIENNDDKLKEMKKKKEKEKQMLLDKNKPLLSDKTLEKVYSARHVKDLPSSRTGGYNHYLYEEKGYSWLGSWFASSSNYEDYKNDGYLSKTFEYTRGESIFKIKFEVENGGDISWYSPNQKAIKNNFYGGDPRCYYPSTDLGSKQENGYKHHKWRIRHKTAYEKNARCYVTFYSRRCDLIATQLKIQDNKNKIQEIENLLKKQTESKDKDENKIIQAHLKNKKLTEKHKRRLRGLKIDMNMILCWSERIFTNVSDRELIHQYLQNYNEILGPRYMITNTNNKHSDYQPGGELEQKEGDDCDNNNNNSSSLTSSMLFGTGLLASSLSKKKN